MKRQLSILLVGLGILFIQSRTFVISQVPLCENAQPFCSDASDPTFPNQTNTDIPVGPDYGCLQRDPGVNDVNDMVNPQWFYFQVSDAGDIELQVSQEDNSQNPIDLDFVMWGPFPDLSTGCTQVMNGESPIQCSSDPDAEETIGLGVLGGGDYWSNFFFGNYIDGTSTPPQGQVGEVYIVLLTNADGQPGTISLEQISGSGATDCSIITACNIDVTATPSSCDASTNSYAVSGDITFSDEPTTGTLIVEDCNGNSTTFSAPFTSPQSYTISGISSNGASCDVTAYFSDETICSGTIAYQSPAPCTGCTPPSILIDDLEICATETADLNTAIDPSSAAATTTFYSSQTDADNATNPISSSVSTAGSYWVRAEDPSDATCFTVLEIQVNVTTVNYTASITDANCGATDGEIVLTATGGSTPYAYSIDNGATTQSTGTFSGIAAGVYEIEITEANGCSTDGSETVANIGGPSIDTLIVTNPTCYGVCDGEIEVVATGGTTPYSYTWLDSNNTTVGNDDASITGLCAGDYTLEITDDAAVCPIVSTITLTEPGFPDATFSLTDFCEGKSNNATITGDIGGTFSFTAAVNDGATIDSLTGEITNGVGGTTYDVEYETPGNCSVTSVEQVTVFESPIADFVADPMVTEIPATNISFTNTSTGGDSFLWNFGDNTAAETAIDVSHIYPDNAAGEYLVTLIAMNNSGCVDSISSKVKITLPGTSFKVPNVFTPNDDQTNDFFKLIDPQNINSLSIDIQNRWGNLVFESDKVDFEWNGSVKNGGTNCSDGTYFYSMRVTTFSGEKEIKQGFVRLSR